MESKPYLAIIGAPPFRFQELAPPPDLVTRPSAAAPPHPASKDERNDVIVPETPASPPPPVTTAPPPPSTDSVATPEPAAAGPAAPPPVAPRRSPALILRDELHPETRAEDFLPFFQIPTSQPGDMNVVPVPRAPSGPAPLPVSSATYTQTPR